MKAAFYKNLHIAVLESESSWHELKVNNLLQNTDAKQPSINAFLGARYSRSADPVVEIAREVYESGKDAAKKLENIFYNYGHKSVGDMADVFLCLENIPILMAQRFFYLNPVHAGQERSTRYQDFSKPKFIRFPDDAKVPGKIATEYESLIQLALQNYRELQELTLESYRKHFQIGSDPNEISALKARVFDTIRYFIPIGLQTSIGVVMSARSWAERISYYRASKFRIERELGELIYAMLSGTDLLTDLGYLPEVDGLVKHTEADNSRNNSTDEILTLLKKVKLAFTDKKDLKGFCIKTDINTVTELLSNYLLLLDPAGTGKFTKKDLSGIIAKVGKIIGRYHDHHHQLGNVAQSGSILIDGMSDYGVLKDLNRHRSFEKFIPLYEENLDLNAELARDPKDLYQLCDYLDNPGLETLKAEYQQRMTAYYTRLKKWFVTAKKVLDPEVLNEYTRYLLTHGYSTRYKFYASIDDLAYTIALRTRNGGHIAYRKLTYDWLLELAKQEPFWNWLVEKLQAVDPDSRSQFIDRS
jgi:thymidylate synthase ThyX